MIQHEIQPQDLFRSILDDEGLDPSWLFTLPPELKLTASFLNDPENLAPIVAHLEKEINVRFWADIDTAVNYAETIILLGEKAQHKPYIALGKMLKGDALAIQGKNAKLAWQLQEEAGQFFREIGDEIGWARTRTGHLGICIEYGEVDLGLEEANEAEAIFRLHHQDVYLLRLKVNQLKILNHTGYYQETINEFQKIYPLTQTYQQELPYQIAALLNNVGNAYWYLGDIVNALHWFSHARDECLKNGFVQAGKIATLNTIGASRALGRYDQALANLNSLLKQYEDETSIYATRAKIEIIECYLALNRFTDAVEYAVKVEQDFAELDGAHFSDKAQHFRHKASALIGIGHFTEAKLALQNARLFFAKIKSETWLANCDYQLGWIALQENQAGEAVRLGLSAKQYFEQNNQLASLVRVMFLLTEAFSRSEEIEKALTVGEAALEITRKIHLPAQRYRAHLLCGRLEKIRNNTRKSNRHFLAAFRLLKHLRKSLTITLRGNYLADKDEALHSLMHHYLNEGQNDNAMRLLEESRALTTSDYLSNRDRLLWFRGDTETEQLLDSLETLREQHRLLYRQAFEQFYLTPDEIVFSDTQLAENQLREVEEKIQQTVEALYLRSALQSTYHIGKAPDLSQLQDHLQQDEAMISYYVDQDVWLFWIDKEAVQTFQLPINSQRLARATDRLRFLMLSGLQFDQDPATAFQLRTLTKNIGAKLFEMLLQPVWDVLLKKRRLYLVPYGPLHSLPFNLLVSPEGYLIESHELITLPSVGFLLRPSIEWSSGVTILTDDRRELLPFTRQEGEMVAELLGGQLFHNQTAHLNDNLHGGTILHIAAHGEHRPDQPDLSYVQLADQQYFTADLLQQDLSYELVTLSGCETGVVTWQGGETLVGLTQGVLCAGAGAAVASYWRVEDNITLDWMRHFYQNLSQGLSKSKALQNTQIYFLRNWPERHPAFWGAFQLIGDPRALAIFE